jgi:hypothetical protein
VLLGRTAVRPYWVDMAKRPKKRKSKEALPLIVSQPEEGKIAPAIDQFVGDFLSEYGADDLDVGDYHRMALTCPPLKAALKTITLISLSYLGDYVHEDARIQKWGRLALSRMNGSLRLSVAQMLSAIYMGYSCTEIALRVEGTQWTLDSLMLLPPERWRFRGLLGDIQDLVYTATDELYIPYERVLHVVHNAEFAMGNPYGVSDLKAARAAYQAWLIVVAEMLVAGKRNATPLLVGYVDPTTPDMPVLGSNGEPVLGADGKPKLISAAKQLADALSGVDNKTALTTSLRNKVEAIGRAEGYQIYFEALRYLHKLMYLALCFPETALEVNAGSGGDSNLAKQQLALMRTNYESLMSQIKDQLIDQLMRPLIYLNFGVQESYGFFDTPQQHEEDRVLLVESLLSSANSGIIAPSDERLRRRLEQSLGLESAGELNLDNP